jgi:beta-glucanase (GH16 family)
MYAVPSGNIWDDYHLYAVEWAPGSVKFYVDDTLYETDTSSNLTMGELWAFDHPFYVILNLEVGGSWAGAPNASSFPMTMLVDYVRVYKAM